jgi:hypothetical protein
MTMTKYTLEDIYAVSSNNFEFEIPEDSVKIINMLAKEVGSTSILVVPKFKSKSIIKTGETNKYTNKKKRYNKEQESNSEEWEKLRTFKSTKFEEKVGIDSEIDQIRLHLNKLTDKTYETMKEKIIKNIENILLCSDAEDYLNKISTIIYEISSNNKFYSVVYAKLYKELCEKYIWLKEVFENKFNNYLNNFENTEYVEPNENYDRYCELNKLSEIRKSQSVFYLNLVRNGYIKPISVYRLLRGLIDKLLVLIHMENKNNAVDDIVENIALLFDKEIIMEVEDDDDNEEIVNKCFQLTPDGIEYSGEIVDFINLLSNCKTTEFKSLTNKSIFKFMDLVD